MPVVLVSARGHAHVKVEVLDRDTDDDVVKPFGTSEPMAHFRTALRQSVQMTDGGIAPGGQLATGRLEVD